MENEKQFSTLESDFLKQYIRLVQKHLGKISLITFASLIIGVVYAFFFAAKYFKSTAVFFPPSGGSAIIPVTDVTRGLFSAGESRIASAEQVSTIFTSEDYQRRIIEKFHLVKRYKHENEIAPIMATTKELNDLLKLKNQGSSALTYENIYSFEMACEDKDKDTAALICGYAVGLLDSVISDLATSKARASRVFIESQLSVETQRLDSIQSSFQKFQKKTNIIDFETQSKGTLTALIDARNEIQKTEIELSMLKIRQGENGSDVLAMQQLLRKLKELMVQLQVPDTKGPLVSPNKLIEMGPEYSNLSQKTYLQTKIVDYMRQQLESERIEEARNTSHLQVVSYPRSPEYKSRPKRMAIVASFAIGGCAIYLFVLLYYSLYSSLRRPKAE
jgi:capsule polysaccharide export protein KpsE/RkpR